MKHLSVQSSMNGLKSPVILLCFNSSGARVADTCTKTLCHYFFGEVAFVLLILITLSWRALAAIWEVC